MTRTVRRWIRTAADIRPDEFVPVGLMFGYGFLALTSYYVIKPVRNSIFVDRVGADQLPWVYILTALVVIVVMVGYSRFVDRVKRMTLLLGSFFGLGAVLVLFWWLLRGGSTFWTSGAFYVFGKLYPLFLVSQFWLVSNLLFTTSQARRLFGPIGVGLILGGIAGSTISGLGAELIGTESLLLVSVGILGLCAVIVRVLGPHMSRGATASGRLTEGMSGGAVSLLKSSSHLKTIALILGLTIIVGTLIDWQFNRAVELAIEGEDAKTEFFGLFFAALNVVSVGVQLLLTGFVLRRFGLRIALLVLPVGLAVATAGVLAVPTLVAATLAKGTEGSLRYSLDQATRELLFLPVAEPVKYKVKPLIDLGIYRGGTGLGGVLLLVLVNGLGLGLRAVGVAALVAIVFWIWAALRMRKEFGESLRRLIGVRDVRLEELVVGHLNAETRRELTRVLRDGDERRLTYALELLALDPDPAVAPEVAGLLDHEADAVRAKAVAMLTAMGAGEYLEDVRPLLADPSLGVKVEAIAYVCELGGGDPAQAIQGFLDTEQPEVRTAAVGCVLRHGDRSQREGVLGSVRKLVTSDDPADRRVAARLLGGVEEPDDEVRSLLSDLVQDPEVAVCHEAMEAVGRARVEALVPLLLDRLSQVAYRGPARTALEAFGPAIHGRLLDRLCDSSTPPEVRTAIPGLLVPYAGQGCVDRMATTLPSLGPNARYEVLKALNKLRRDRPDLRFEGIEFEDAARREVESAHLWTAHRVDAETDGTLLGRALDQRRLEAVERALRTLALQGPQEDLYAAFTALASSDRVTKERGFELLDTVLPHRHRRWFDPLVNPDAEDERRGEAAEELFGLARRTPEAVLATLVEGPDPWVAALAHRERGGRGLPPAVEAEDLEGWMRASALLATRTFFPCNEAIMDIVDRADALRRVSLFQDVRTEDLAAIATLTEERTVREGETVFDEGDPGGVLYAVVEGRVEARKKGRLLFTAEPGETVGSLSLLDGLPTNYEAVATADSRLLGLGREDFKEVLSERDRVVEGVVRYLTGVVRGLNEAPEGSD